MSPEAAEKPGINPWKVLAWMADLLAGLAIVMCFRTMDTLTTVNNSVANIDKRLAIVENNRFTANDGLMVWKDIANLRETMARLPVEYPPKWFVDRVERLESLQVRTENKVDANNILLINLVAKHEKEKP
jgi:hypothetical protein